MKQLSNSTNYMNSPNFETKIGKTALGSLALRIFAVGMNRHLTVGELIGWHN